MAAAYSVAFINFLSLDCSMDNVKKWIWGPDPREQYRQCQSTIRKNKRQMDRQMQDLDRVQSKTKRLIRTAAKKGDMKSAKMYAREYRNINKTQQRLHLSKATLDSISMKLAEQQQLIKIKGSMQKSTGIMRDINTLVKLPEMSRTVMALSRELTKSGVIDEMVDDMIEDNAYEDDDEEEEEQIDQILDEVLKDQQTSVNNMPDTVKDTVKEEPKPQEVEEDSENEDLLANMRQRLSALQ